MTAFDPGRPALGQNASRPPTNRRRRPPLHVLAPRVLAPLVVAPLVVALAVGALAPAARAAGTEYTLRQDDLILTVDSTWAGCMSGGYYPLRIQVVNRARPRALTFRFSGGRNRDERLPTVVKRLTVDQNATAKFTLAVPCVGDGTYGELTVWQDGRLLKGLSKTLSIPDVHRGGTPRTALLVISPGNVDCNSFEAAVTANTPEHRHGGYARWGYSSTSEDHAVIRPALLPDSWISYSGIDMVAVPLETLEQLEVEAQTALLHWVHTGGILLVYEVGQPAAESARLAKLLETTGRAGADEWRPAQLSNRRGIPNLQELLEAAASGSWGGSMTATFPGSAATPAGSSSPSASSEPLEFHWKESPGSFARRELMLGTVIAFPDNPFPGTPHDWDWLLKSLPLEQRVWTARHGLSARNGSGHFLHFLIPSVKGVPVVAFLLLITLFTIVIGPLNYLWLWKQRRLYLLILTIPVIAVATSVALFGYSAIAHGFGTKARVRSLTMLDQTSNTAVTHSRIALYSGLAPSDGLWFSPDTAVFTIWPEDGGFESAATDWTERQNLRSGWLRSRTRTQFLTVAHRDERGRLEVGTPSAAALPVTNGLEWGLQALVVEAGGELYYGEDIPAGASARLTVLSSKERSRFAELLEEHPVQSPVGVESGSGTFFTWDPSYYYGHDAEVPADFSSSRLERTIDLLQNLRRASVGLPRPNSYAAVAEQRPGIELGLEKAREEASLHVIVGQF